MKLIQEPQVYLIGEQTVRQEGLDRFLVDHGVAWQTDTEVAAEALVETAGRLCFDDKTDMLTPEGWVSVADLEPGTPVATLSPADHSFEFQVPRHVHAYDYDGDLYVVDKRDVSFAVTPEHRQYAGIGIKDGYAEFAFHRTHTLIGRRFRVITAGRGYAGTVPASIDMPDAKYSQRISNQYGFHTTAIKRSSAIDVKGKHRVVALAMLVAHYVANGSIADQSGTGRGIAVYGREKDEVVGLCTTLGLGSSTHVDKRNGCPKVCISGGMALARWFTKECGRGYANKKLPRWVLELPTEHLLSVWNILVKTDGHRYANGREVLFTGSKTVASQAQELLAKIGSSSSIAPVHGSNSPCYAITRKMGRPACVSGKDMEKCHYSGKVYCVTTDNGIVYVRRNGKVHYSGNCYMSFAAPRPGGNRAYIDHVMSVGHGSVVEHAVWGLVVTGISRSLSHELVRHRIGLSPSQLSQRYVDESVAEYVVPPDLQFEVDCARHRAAPRNRRSLIDQLEQCGWASVLYPEAEKLASTDRAAYSLAADAGDKWLQAVEQSHKNYVWLSTYLAQKAQRERPDLQRTDARKFARQAARSVLPNATETKLYLTFNARALRHFIELRASRHADPEIRLLAVKMWRVARDAAPHLFGDYQEAPLPDGSVELTTPYRKV